jgi:hypothetical protein
LNNKELLKKYSQGTLRRNLQYKTTNKKPLLEINKTDVLINKQNLTIRFCIGFSFKFLLKVGFDESIVNAPLVNLQSKITNNAKSEVRFKQLIRDLRGTHHELITEENGRDNIA